MASSNALRYRRPFIPFQYGMEVLYKRLKILVFRTVLKKLWVRDHNRIATQQPSTTVCVCKHAVDERWDFYIVLLASVGYVHLTRKKFICLHRGNERPRCSEFQEAMVAWRNQRSDENCLRLSDLVHVYLHEPGLLLKDQCES